MSTYTPIASATLTSAQSSITFNSVPQTYTDLVIVMNVLTSVDGASIQFQFNTDTGNNYSNTLLEGNGSTATSTRESNQSNIQLCFNVGGNSTNPQASIANIMNYSNTTTNKTVLARWNSATGGTYPGVSATVGLWRSTSAITNITIFPGSGNFNANSTFNLYGIATSTKALGGNTITTDGTYWYHTFTSSGIFTPLTALSNVDYLVVAGGGGGGEEIAGGGGAGGLRCTVTATGGGGALESKLSLSANTNYTVTIGAGGTGGINSSNTSATNGSNSVFSTITSTGGGRGGSYIGSAQAGAVGGSGGGGNAASDFGAGGAGTANQGYAGATAIDTGARAGGGGGGAGAAAVTPAGGSGLGSPGGVGVATAISGTSTYYAGGGGGGFQGSTVQAGGTGGGGNGGVTSPSATAGSAGTANTGGGGGGGGNNRDGGAGGSGIVIVRYAV